MGRYCDFNQLMVPTWKFIPFGRGGMHQPGYRERMEEAKAWCTESAHGRWSVGHSRTAPTETKPYGEYRTGFFFRGPNDALLFKLAWGGE